MDIRTKKKFFKAFHENGGTAHAEWAFDAAKYLFKLGVTAKVAGKFMAEKHKGEQSFLNFIETEKDGSGLYIKRTNSCDLPIKIKNTLKNGANFNTLKEAINAKEYL